MDESERERKKREVKQKVTYCLNLNLGLCQHL